MVEQPTTYIGQVKHVLGSTVTVELDGSLAGVAPIYRGHLQPVGQIGSLVRIPQGLVDLIGAVSLLGISELSGAQEPTQSVQSGNRWLQVQLLGEVDRGTSRFRRGVGSYPGLDDPVHFTTVEHLLAVFPDLDEQHVRLGHLSTSYDVPVCLDLNSLVLRHSAVVGSTGSGKTSAVTSMLQARRVVPHGKTSAVTSMLQSLVGSGEDGRPRTSLWWIHMVSTLALLRHPRQFEQSWSRGIRLSTFHSGHSHLTRFCARLSDHLVLRLPSALQNWLSTLGVTSCPSPSGLTLILPKSPPIHLYHLTCIRFGTNSNSRTTPHTT